MADNVTADPGTGGAVFVTANFTFSGDNAHAPGGFQGLLTGSEGSWTYSLLVGGAGAVTAGTQRVTLASDDPAVASLDVIDDWDESDRAKVNIIAGQAGVAGGSGTVGATTQRVVLATDVGLPTGSNVIGAVTQSGAWSVAISSGGPTQYTEDAASATDPVGNALIVVRNDARSGSLTTTDGDNVALRGTNSGELYVKHVDSIPVTDNSGSLTVDGTVSISGTVTVGSHDVTNAGTFAVQITGAALTSLQLIDDAISGTGFNISQMNGVNVTMGNGASGTGVQRVTIANDSTGVIATVTTVTTVSTVTSLSQFAGNAINLGNGASGTGTLRVTVANDSTGILAGITTVTTVSTVTSLSQFAGNAINLGNGASGTGTLRVTLANDSTGVIATVSTVTTVTTLTGGGIAHDSPDSGNPHKIGTKSAASLATATLVADLDRSNAVSDLDGALITRDQFPLGDLKSDATSNTDGASTASTVFTNVASTKNYITGIHVFRTDSGTTTAYIDFRDGTGGAVLWRMVLPPNGGSVLPASSTPYFRTSAATALAYDVSAALSTVYINVSGFQSKV